VKNVVVEEDRKFLSCVGWVLQLPLPYTTTPHY